MYLFLFFVTCNLKWGHGGVGARWSGGTVEWGHGGVGARWSGGTVV